VTKFCPDVSEVAIDILLSRTDYPRPHNLNYKEVMLLSKRADAGQIRSIVKVLLTKIVMLC
jgi:hypothetical protein